MRFGKGSRQMYRYIPQTKLTQYNLLRELINRKGAKEGEREERKCENKRRERKDYK